MVYYFYSGYRLTRFILFFGGAPYPMLASSVYFTMIYLSDIYRPGIRSKAVYGERRPMYLCTVIPRGLFL